MKKELVKGDTWYLVGERWWKQWKKFVGYDTWDQFGVGEELNDPGPIDNSSLFAADGCTLKDRLLDTLDYDALPEEAWFKLVSWYGVVSDDHTIPRKVFEHGMYMKNLKIEVYLLELRLGCKSDPKETVPRNFSRTDTIGHIASEMRKILSIPSEVETRVWAKYMSNTYGLLRNMEYTVMDSGIYHGQDMSNPALSLASHFLRRIGSAPAISSTSLFGTCCCHLMRKILQRNWFGRCQVSFALLLSSSTFHCHGDKK